jgi:hypothetical protein
VLAPQSIPGLTPRQQASIAAIGLITVVSVGVTTCIMLVLALLWLVVHLALLTLQAFVETLSAIGTTYAAADPLVKFLLFVALGVVMYRVYRKVAKGHKR